MKPGNKKPSDDLEKEMKNTIDKLKSEKSALEKILKNAGSGKTDKESIKQINK
jgi:hypothetical protein